MGFEFITEPNGCISNHWLNCILLSDQNERDAFLEFTNNNGIMTRPAWRLVKELPMFKNCLTDKLSNAKAISATLVSLPSSVINEK